MLARSALPRQGPSVARDSARDYDILILDASMKQSLASVRSLGRAGLRVAAGESVAQFEPALPMPAFRSRYCLHSLMLPDLINEPAAFGAVLRPYREQLAEMGCFLALASDSVLEIANDKDQTLAVARSLNIAQPATVRIEGNDDLATAASEFGFPFVLKPTVSWTEQAQERLVPVDVIDKGEAEAFVSHFLKSGSGVLAQEWIPGRREGVTLFVRDDEVLAGCGHVAHRTSPPLGGASVVRESIEVPADTMDAAVRLVKAIGLQGVCEVEFRRDAENRLRLMEVNARLAGTIENAVQSGVDLPLMIWQWATGLEMAPVASYRYGVRSRWLHGDLRWLSQNWGRAGRPDSVPRLRAFYTVMAEFAKSFHYDYFDIRDLKPFLAELRYTMHVFSKGFKGARVP